MNLIAYIITTVFSIIAWHPIRDHHLVYINQKNIRCLSLSIKVFSCNLFLAKFRQLLFINKFLTSTYQMVKNHFFCLFFLIYTIYDNAMFSFYLLCLAFSGLLHTISSYVSWDPKIYFIMHIGVVRFPDTICQNTSFNK